jgi:hypothetical protein
MSWLQGVPHFQQRKISTLSRQAEINRSFLILHPRATNIPFIDAIRAARRNPEVERPGATPQDGFDKDSKKIAPGFLPNFLKANTP